MINWKVSNFKRYTAKGIKVYEYNVTRLLAIEAGIIKRMGKQYWWQ